MLINHIGSTFISKTLTLLVAAWLLGACQTSGTPSLSLDEAKRVTASFEGGFVPPPRTITDITGILEQQKRKDLETLGQMRVVADENPPVAGNNAELAMFYYKRGEKADHLGRQNQALADYNKAAELFELSNNKEFASYALEAAAYITSYLGNYSDAIKGIHKAIKLTRPDWQDSILSLVLVLAGMAAEAGDFALAEQQLKRARPLLNEVRSWDDITHRSLTIKETLHSTARAMVLAKRGKLDEAEVLMRDAVKNWKPYKDSAGNNSDSKLAGQTYVWYLRHLALILIAQERYVEAEVIAREGLLHMLSDYGRYSSYVASALNLLTKTLLEQGRYGEAGQLAEVTIHVYEEVGVKLESWAFNDARGNMADILVGQGKWEEALEIYAQIKHDLVTDLPTYEKYFSQNLNWAFAQFNSGNIEAAAAIAENVYATNESLLGEKHYATAEALGFLAATQVVSNDLKAALSNFQDSIPILVTRSRQSHSEQDSQAFRRQRLELILESYIHLLSNIRGTSLEHEAGFDVIAEAFRIADLSRGRSVQSALNASSARAAIRDPELANLARREQDAQKQVSVLYGQLANLIRSEPGLTNASATKDIQIRIDDLRDARAALMKEIEGQFPDYAQLINPKPITIEAARAVLDSDEAMIATYVGSEETYVWAASREGDIEFAVVDISHKTLLETVQNLRLALEPDATTLGDIPDFDLTTAYKLYTKILKPVEAAWKGKKSLLVVAHGPLGHLPFSLLPTKPVSLKSDVKPLFANYRNIPWLARSHAVTMLPSAASLRTLRLLPKGAETRTAFVGFADPWFSQPQVSVEESKPKKTTKVAKLTSRGILTRGLSVKLRAAPTTTGLDSAELAQLPRLPETAEELQSIAKALNADPVTAVFTGNAANEGRVKSMNLSETKVIAFATHGLVPGDLNGLTQPALALSAPKSADDKEDGLLTMGEILGLKLNADWIVLSACNTASGDGAGAEAASGLGRAFFYAGARALLVSNWPVETSSAKELTTELFRSQAAESNLTRAEALRRSMVAMIDRGGFLNSEGKIVFSYAHPIFWAPFSLIGDGGGGSSSASH
jgi:CHAT domain-containing protein/tetratricopeptide (TPR) repeat protein